MMRLLEGTAFAGLAVTLHLGLWAWVAGSGADSAGDGGDAPVSLRAAPAQVAALARAWTHPVDAAQDVAAPPAAAITPQTPSVTAALPGPTPPGPTQEPRARPASPPPDDTAPAPPAPAARPPEGRAATAPKAPAQPPATLADPAPRHPVATPPQRGGLRLPPARRPAAPVTEAAPVAPVPTAASPGAANATAPRLASVARPAPDTRPSATAPSPPDTRHRARPDAPAAPSAPAAPDGAAAEPAPPPPQHRTDSATDRPVPQRSLRPLARPPRLVRRAADPAPPAPTPAPTPAPRNSAAQAAQTAQGTGGRQHAGNAAADQPATLSPAARQSLMARWGAAIRAEVARRRRYPRGTNAQGTTLLRLSIGRQGRLRSVAVIRSAGSPALDRAALAAVRGARFPAAPRRLPGAVHAFDLPVSFTRK